MKLSGNVERLLSCSNETLIKEEAIVFLVYENLTDGQWPIRLSSAQSFNLSIISLKLV